MIDGAPSSIFLVQVDRGGIWYDIEKLFNNEDQLKGFLDICYPMAMLRVIQYGAPTIYYSRNEMASSNSIPASEEKNDT